MNPEKLLSNSDDTTDINLETSYGWFKWRPVSFQKYASRPVTFLIIICCCAFVQEFTVSGIVNLCVSSVEKQFRLSSTQTGAVISAYDIAFLAASGPISWAGGRSVHEASKIRYLTVGLLCLAGGSIIFASPHFFTPPYEFSSISETCQRAASLESGNASVNFTTSTRRSNAGPLIALLTGNVLHGIGSAPLYTLGVAYIDENSEYASVPLYLGIYYAVSVLGPAFGFLFGAFSLTFYVDRWRQTTARNVHLDTSDPNWVGAWWLSFLVCAGLALLVTIPLSGFPAHLPGMLERFKARSDTSFAGIKRKLRTFNGKNDRNTHKSRHTTRSITSTVKDCFGKICRSIGKREEVASLDRVNSDSFASKVEERRVSLPLGCLNVNFGNFLKELGSLFTNIPFVFLTLAGAADGFLLNSFAAFIPKYLEMQFAISAKDASLYVGALTVPAGTLGMFLGGYLIKKFNVSVVGMFKTIFWSSLLNMLCMFVLLITCPESKFAGVNYRSPYLINSRTGDVSTGVQENAGKIEFACNLGCNCEFTYDPVCGSNAVMYYSACHAGCASKGNGSDARNYYLCDCVPSNLTIYDETTVIPPSKTKYEMQGSAKLGSCPTDCARWKMLTFLGIMFFGLFLMLMIAVIAVNCTLKCVEGAENSLAMGVQWVFVRLLGTIPGPIIFGKIIDRNCLFWEMRPIQTASLSLGEFEYGSCKLYTNFLMGVDLFLLTLGCKIVAQLFYGVAYYSYWFYDKNPSSSPSPHNTQTLELQSPASPLTK